MFKFTISGAKPPKSRTVSCSLQCNLGLPKEYKECRRLIANIIGINEETVWGVVVFLLDNLEGDLYLGTQRRFSQRSQNLT